MIKEVKSGYKGKVFGILKRAGCNVGDIIRVIKREKTYEGILIPRSETGDEKHIVVKLKSGYNVGIRITSDVKIKKVGKGIKPSFASPPLPKQKPELPKAVTAT